MNNKLIKFNLSQRKSKIVPDLKSGDIVKVHRKIKEGEKERIQIFEGIIIAIKGKQSSSPTITVRKVSNGVGVELVLPIYSPNIDKIELVKRAKIRRSKLYYIRNKSAKSLRLKYQDMSDFVGVDEVESDNTETEIDSSGDDNEKKEKGKRKNAEAVKKESGSNEKNDEKVASESEIKKETKDNDEEKETDTDKK